MLSMLLFGFGVDKDVINLQYDELIEVLVEERVHKTPECSRSIGEAKGHDGTHIGHNE